MKFSMLFREVILVSEESKYEALSSIVAAQEMGRSLEASYHPPIIESSLLPAPIDDVI